MAVHVIDEGGPAETVDLRLGIEGEHLKVIVMHTVVRGHVTALRVTCAE
jgi:hypothetical protein